MKDYYSVRSIRTVKGGMHTCVGLVVAGNGYQGKRETLLPGTYYCDDASEISLITAYLGGSWEVFMGGNNPSVAVSENKVVLRSLGRLGRVSSLALEMGEEPACDDTDASWHTFMVASRYRGAIEALCGNPERGLTAVINSNAPGLQKIRKHEGMNILARKHVYFGGRTEVFAGLSNENVTQYDMRSAYAWGYGDTIPGAFQDISRTVPKGDNFLALVTVTVPRSQWVPPVPFRSQGGTLIFPTGEWETWLAGPEYRMIEPSGMIRSVHKVYRFADSDALSGFAKKIFALRNETQCPVEKALCKVLLNTAYGCLGAHPTFPKVLIRPKVVPPGAEVIKPGVYRVQNRPKFSLSHVPAAAVIASRVRARLWAALSTCGLDGPGGESAYYCDTDSVFLSSNASPPFPLGDGAGDWRAVGHYKPGCKWVAPKTYSLNGGAVLRASGVSVKEAARYLAGESVSARRVTGFIHTATRGYASEIPVTVTLRTDRKNKRAALDGYKTAPLTIEEARTFER